MVQRQQERGNGQQNAPRVRGHSIGEYGHPPIVPRPINISSTHILDTTATKTLLAILRNKWPAGVYSFYQAPGSFWPTVLKEFRRYYCYHPGVPDADGDAVVKQHVVRTMTQTLYEDKNRALLRAKRYRTSLRQQRPAYFAEHVWHSFCAHWHNTTFWKKSVINKQNKKKLRVVHTTGAKPFIKLKEELTQKYNEPPTTLQVWNASHKKKHTDEWASEGARSIGEQMEQILESQQASQERTHHWDSGISALIEAQGPIRKNRVLGLPRIRANSIVPREQQTRGTDKTQSNCIGTSSSSGAGPSRSGPGIPNEILVELVDRTLAAFRSDPSYDRSRHPSREQLHLVAQEVISGSDPSSAPHIHEVMRPEMVQLIVRIFVDLFQDLLKRLSDKEC